MRAEFSVSTFIMKFQIKYKSLRDVSIYKVFGYSEIELGINRVFVLFYVHFASEYCNAGDKS